MREGNGPAGPGGHGKKEEKREKLSDRLKNRIAARMRPNSVISGLELLGIGCMIRPL